MFYKQKRKLLKALKALKVVDAHTSEHTQKTNAM